MGNALRSISRRLVQASAKRPINHRDCDGWNGIQSQALSRNAKFLAYSQVPEGRDDQQEHESSTRCTMTK